MDPLRHFNASKRLLLLIICVLVTFAVFQPGKCEESIANVESNIVATQPQISASKDAKSSEERLRLPFLKMRELANAIYDHKPLTSLRYTFESQYYGSYFLKPCLDAHNGHKNHFTNLFSLLHSEEPLVAGELKNISFKHLGPFLHSESTQGSWVGVIVRQIYHFFILI